MSIFDFRLFDVHRIRVLSNMFVLRWAIEKEVRTTTAKHQGVTEKPPGITLLGSMPAWDAQERINRTRTAQGQGKTTGRPGHKARRIYDFTWLSIFFKADSRFSPFFIPFPTFSLFFAFRFLPIFRFQFQPIFASRFSTLFQGRRELTTNSFCSPSSPGGNRETKSICYCDFMA